MSRCSEASNRRISFPKGTCLWEVNAGKSRHPALQVGFHLQTGPSLYRKLYNSPGTGGRPLDS